MEQRWPAIAAVRQVCSAFYIKEAGRVVPAKLCRAAAAAARQKGVEISEDVGVTGLRVLDEGSGVVVGLTTGTSLRARCVVVAAGVWSGELLASGLANCSRPCPIVMVPIKQQFIVPAKPLGPMPTLNDVDGRLYSTLLGWLVLIYVGALQESWPAGGGGSYLREVRYGPFIDNFFANRRLLLACPETKGCWDVIICTLGGSVFLYNQWVLLSLGS